MLRPTKKRFVRKAGETPRRGGATWDGMRSVEEVTEAEWLIREPVRWVDLAFESRIADPTALAWASVQPSCPEYAGQCYT